MIHHFFRYRKANFHKHRICFVLQSVFLYVIIYMRNSGRKEDNDYHGRNQICGLC